MANLRKSVTSYGAALLSVAAGIALPLISKPFVGQSAPYVSFVPAVLLSAWYGGFGPGLLTTLLLVISALSLEGTLFTGNSTPASRVFGAFMFSIAGLAICLVIRALRLAQAAALDAAAGARAAETSAQDERDRLELIVRDLPVGVLIANQDATTFGHPVGKRTIELANPAAVSIFGSSIRPGDDLYFHRPAFFRNSNGEEFGEGRWPIERSLGSDETVVNEEIEILSRDGATRTVMVNSRPLQGTRGRQRAAIATYSDVTSLRAVQEELRRSEARLRRLFDSPIIGVVSGVGDVAQEANDEFLRMLGLSRSDLKSGTIRLAALTPDEFQAVDSRIEHQLRDRGFSDPAAKEFRRSDGQRVPVMVGATTFESGQPFSWIAWVLDLSEHRRLEERLRQAAKAESIGLLAGGVAHDFNNLLTIVMGNATLAHAQSQPDSPPRRHLENVLRAAERATDLTRQLLAYAGKGQFVVRPIDVSTVVQDISGLFRAAANKGIEMRLDLTPGLPAVEADATQLQQLAMNLVINGMESLDEQPGTVCISTALVHLDAGSMDPAALASEVPPGDYVRIQVSDTGCGMDAETRQRIFDPFFTTKFTGRGLGLAAAAGIVRAHHGFMNVRSSPGDGSVFEVFLPALPAIPEPAPTSPPAPQESATSLS